MPTGGRQVALLPGAGAARQRPRRGRLAAHLADEGSGGHARRQRRGRRLLQQRASRRTSKASVAAGLREGRYRLLYVSPERLAGEGSDGFLAMLGRCQRQLHRGGRGALHQPVGARFPSRVPPARTAARACSPTSACMPTPRPRRRGSAATSSAQLGLRNHARAGRIVRPAEPRLPRAARAPSSSGS